MGLTERHLFENEDVPENYEWNLEDAVWLKDQEPALPTWSQGKAYCGKCGQRLPRKCADREINYCCYCGRKVKWE